jgi:flagellar biosynthesis/type III secretory pathway chaperone
MNDPLDQAMALARSLADTLEEEFTALKTRDIARVERLQPGKAHLLESLAALAGPPGGRTAAGEDPDLRDLLRQCQQAHRRNETLVQHQLAAVRGALGALTADSALQSVEVYDRLGQISARRRGRGYSDA